MGTDTIGNTALAQQDIIPIKNNTILKLNDEETKLITEHRKRQISDATGAKKLAVIEREDNHFEAENPNESVRDGEQKLTNVSNQPRVDGLQNMEYQKSNAMIDKIVSTLCKNSVSIDEVQKQFIIKNLESTKGDVALTDAFGRLKDFLKCPTCNGKVKKLPGRQMELLKCDKCGKLDKFDLAPQLPTEIMKMFLKRLSKEQLKIWINYTLLCSESAEPS